MIRILILHLLFLLANTLFGQEVIKKKFPKSYSFEVSCEGKALDGSPIITAWAQGSNKKEALKLAYQKAIATIILDGTRSNDQDCTLAPLATEANVEREYAKYFHKLLYKKDKYLKYIYKKDRFSKNDAVVYKNPDKNEYLAKVTAAVLREDLRKNLTRKDLLDKYKKEKKIYK